MIKILEEGKGKTSFTMVCDICGCKFQFDLEDISYRYVKCPQCNSYLTVKDKSIPNFGLCASCDHLDYPALILFPPTCKCKFFNELVEITDGYACAAYKFKETK